MSITTTIKAGESGKTITLNEGKALTLKGDAGSAGVAYLLDQALGGTNSKQSWVIGAAALPPIGPLDGAQKVLVTCSVGSVSATVAEAVNAVSAKTKRDASYGMNSALRLMSNNSTASSGAGAGTGRLFDSQHPALSDYYAVAAVYANYDTTAVMRVNKAKIAACPQHLMPNVTGLAWSTDLTSGGVSAFDVPAATAGLTTGSANKIPGFLTTDVVWANSVARSDGGKFPLTRVRSHIADNVYPLTLPGTLANYNALVGADGLQYGAYSFPGSTSDITASGAGLAEYGGNFEPVALRYYYYKRTIEIACGGDSLTQGAGTLGNVMGWPTRLAMMNSSANDFVISPISHGVSGQKLEDSHATLLAYCASIKPSHAALFAFSPNNAPAGNAATMDALWKLTVQTVEKLMSLGIQPVVLTSGPVDGYSAADKALVLKQNARVLALPEKVIKVNSGAAIALNGNINPAYSAGDGTHYNDAGYTLIASMVWDAIV